MKNFIKSFDLSVVIAVTIFGFLVALYITVFTNKIEFTDFSSNANTTQTIQAPAKQLVNIAPLSR